MAIVLVNLGNAANDGTGDDLREAFVKVNNNFTEISNQLDFSGQNLGSGGFEVFSKKEDYVLKFRRLVEGNNISMQQFDNTIQISADIPDSRFTVTTNSGTIILGNGINYNLVGGDGASVSANENLKTITIDSGVVNDTSPVLGSSLDGDNYNITNVNNLSAQTLNANDVYTDNLQSSTLTTNALVANTYNGIDLNDQLFGFLNFDNGEIIYKVNNQLEFLVRSTGIDMGSFTSPAAGQIDNGTIL